VLRGYADAGGELAGPPLAAGELNVIKTALTPDLYAVVPRLAQYRSLGDMAVETNEEIVLPFLVSVALLGDADAALGVVPGHAYGVRYGDGAVCRKEGAGQSVQGGRDAVSRSCRGKC
jgi:hypothetical protein